MKESEATKKWCPFKRSHSGGNLGITVYGGNCEGSACMMWEPEYRNEDKDFDLGSGVKPNEIPAGWYELLGARRDATTTIRRYYQIDEGDCGLKSKENGCFYPG